MEENMENNPENPETPPASETPEQPPEEQQPSPPPPDKNEVLWATFCHLSAFACYIGIPFGNILGPLILWFIKKDDMPMVDRNGKEVLNFQISLTIYFFAATPLLCGGPLVALVWVPLAIIHVVFTIIAAIQVNSGKDFRYPITIRLIK